MGFQKIDKRKSYAQALVNIVSDTEHEVQATGIFILDVIQKTPQCTAKVCKSDDKILVPLIQQVWLLQVIFSARVLFLVMKENFKK